MKKFRTFIDWLTIAFFTGLLLYGFMYAWDNDPNFQLSQTYHRAP
jgi:hypothetical protein